MRLVHRWARVKAREGGYPKILAEGGSDFSARGGDSIHKEKRLRGGQIFSKPPRKDYAGASRRKKFQVLTENVKNCSLSDSNYLIH